MNWTQVIGTGAGLLTAISMLPQLIKILKEKKADEISILTFSVLTIGLMLWVVYGVLRQDWPIIITNSFSVAVNLLILIFRIRFSGTK